MFDPLRTLYPAVNDTLAIGARSESRLEITHKDDSPWTREPTHSHCRFQLRNLTCIRGRALPGSTDFFLVAGSPLASPVFISTLSSRSGNRASTPRFDSSMIGNLLVESWLSLNASFPVEPRMGHFIRALR